MLFAIAIYQKVNDQYVIVTSVDPSKGLFAGNQLHLFINFTLPRYVKSITTNTLSYFVQNGEHQYVKYNFDDTFYVLITKEALSDKELGFLFTNIDFIYRNPGKAVDSDNKPITLKTIFNNTQHYISNFIHFNMIKLQIEETKKVALATAEKLLQRGEAIEQLQEKTEQLRITGYNFNKHATELKRKQRCCN